MIDRAKNQNASNHGKSATRIFGTLGSVLFLAIAISAQSNGVVTAIKANLRGTPANTGIIVTMVTEGESFELMKDKAPWYLIQTAKYVGWIHGNYISMDEDSFAETYVKQTAKPKTTSKPVSQDASPFKSEYVGIDNTIIQITNSAKRTLTLNFGAVKYVIPKDGERTIEADGGNYEFHASAPGVLPKSGVKYFAKGYKYSWDFFIVTTYR